MSYTEKTLSSEVKYKGKILNLRVDTVDTKAGESTREIIEHPGGAVVLPLLDNNHVVMIKQYRKPLDRDVLEVPAGKIDPGETPKAAAIRELREETGYSAKSITLLTKMYPSVGYSQECLYIFLAKDLTPGETDFDPGEDIDMLTYDLEDLVDMVMAGKIQDGKTQVAILMASEYISRNRDLSL